MQQEGKIADSSQVNFTTWEPGDLLESLSSLEVRLSRGFLIADPLYGFEKLEGHWAPFFRSLGLEVNISNVSKTLDFPGDLAHLTVLDADGEPLVVGLDDASADVIADCIAPGSSGLSKEIVIEYLERRLASTLTRSWSGKDLLGCYYLSSGWADEVEVVASIELKLELNGRPAVVWFGLGMRLVERLDNAWKTQLKQGLSTETGDELSDNVHLVGIQITELVVPPALLIDYIRSGTVIDLEVEVSPRVHLTLDGEPWMEGELKQFNGFFAIQIVAPSVPNQDADDSMPRVIVEIARVEIEEAAIAEYTQPGAVLLTGKALSSSGVLIISGETVANALIGQIDGRFALNILPK